MEAYVLKGQNKVAQYIATRPIMDLCEETVRNLGMWVTKMWCYQEGLELKGSRVAREATEEEGGEEETEG